MQYENLKLDVYVDEDGEGAPKRIERHRVKSVYVSGVFDATVTIEISPDHKTPIDWFPAATAVTGGDVPAIRTFEHACKWIRVVVSNYVSGMPEVSFGGYDVV